MDVTRCPKCNAQCKLSEANVYLGVLVECPACRCKFEFIAERPVTFARPRLRVPVEPVIQPVAGAQPNTVSPRPPKRKPRISWKSFLVLMAVWSGLALLFHVSIITFLFPVSLILMAFCRTNRALYKKANRKTFAYFSLDKGVEITSSLTIVVAFYLVASWLFDGSTDQSTLGYLWQLEEGFTSFKNLLSKYVIFKPWISALLIAILIVVDLVYAYVVGLGPLDEENPRSLVSRYLKFQRLSKRAYVVLALLCSFTFFGNAVAGEKRARVQVRIDKIRSGYEQAEKATEAALTAAVQQRLLDEIDNNIAYHHPFRGQTFRYYHDIVYTSHDRVESLRKSYSDATTAQADLDPKLKARVKEVTNKPSPAYDGPREVPYSDDVVRDPDPPRTEPLPENLEELTIGKIDEVNKAFENTAKVPRSVSAIKLADGTEILVQLPKSFTKVAKGAAFHELTQRFPFLEPMIDGLVSAFDKTVEERIKAKVGPKLESLLANWFPGRTLTEMDFEYEAGEIVNESEINVSETVVKDTKAAASEFVKTMTESDGLTRKVDEQIEIAKVRDRPSPPSEVLTLPEPTCAVSAYENFRTRMAHAKSLDDLIEARRIYDSDVDKLKEREIAGAKPG